MSGLGPGGPASGARPLFVVVSRREDLPEGGAEVVAMSDFLAGGAHGGRSRATVVNLCRSLKYRSPGYYVSLLADARGQRTFPTIQTLRGLADGEGLFRTLAEEDVPTADPEPPAPPAPEDLREIAVVFGRTVTADHQRIAAAIFRAFQVPLLRVRLRREEGEWKVVQVAPLAVNRLGPEDRRLLLGALERLRDPDWRPPQEARGKHVSIAVLYDEHDPFGPSTEETLEKLERIAARKNVHVARIGLGDIARIGDYDALFLRVLTGLDEPSFRFATRAEALGIPVIDDPTSIIRCSNKVFLHELMRRERIPTPATMVIPPHVAFEEIERELGLPFILKLPDGSFSTAVHKVTSKAAFRARSREMFRGSPLLIAQAWTPTEFDWRVTTLGGRPLFVCKYHMARGHWQIRSVEGTSARYGRVEAVPRDYAPRDVVRLACRVSRRIGQGLYGVDLKETPEGPVVIEVNDNPNLDVGYDDAADGDVLFEDLVDHFVALVERSRRPRPRRAPRRAEPDPILAAARRPIGSRRRREGRAAYRAFEVCGLELEYPIVDRDLNVVHAVEPLLAALAGRPASDVDLGAVGFSNEIMDHVFEVKTTLPPRSLVDAEAWLAEGVRRASAILADHFDARLLPTGMHPWFDPRKARLWTRSHQRVYATYERLFDVRTHGWANVQAAHVNLPCGRDHEAAALMTAAALLTPYLPALAASTPMHDGELQPRVDSRLAFLVDHQARVPETTGDVVPEYCTGLAQYRREVLGGIYAAVDRLPDAGLLRHEFFNARGAVFKLSRQSMEVRILDMQECVKMDVAVAVFVRSALKALTERLLGGEQPLPDRALLVADLHAAVGEGTRAAVAAPHLLPAPGTAREALRVLLGMAREAVRTDEAPYLDLVAPVIERGSLGERIAAALAPFTEDDHAFTDAARRLYVELSECLRENVPWRGR